MNLTISVDDELLERARKLAQQRGVSVQELLRGYLRTLAGEISGAEAADELIALMVEQNGRSGGERFSREDAYEGRL